MYYYPVVGYVRGDAWTKLVDIMSCIMADKIDKFSTENKLLFILSGL